MKNAIHLVIVALVVAFSLIAYFSTMNTANAKNNNHILQEDKLKDISNRLMEVYYSDFASSKNPTLPNDIRHENITYYYYLYFQDAYYEGHDSVFAKQNVAFSNKSDTFVVSKKTVDEIASLFGKENINLSEYLYKDYSSTYDNTTQSYTVKHVGFAGYHNKETFDYTLSNIEIVGDRATVSYNAYYTDDYNKFWKYSKDLMEMPDWTFNVKVGIYKIHYKIVDGKIVLDKTEYVAQPGFRFYTQ